MYQKAAFDHFMMKLLHYLAHNSVVEEMEESW